MGPVTTHRPMQKNSSIYHKIGLSSISVGQKVTVHWQMSIYLVGTQTAQLCGNKSLSSELLKPRAHGQKEHGERTWEMNQFSSECSWPSQASGMRLWSAKGVSGGLNAQIPKPFPWFTIYSR